MTKQMLERSWVEVQVDGQPVRIKVGHRSGRIVTATPEFSDVAASRRPPAATGRPCATCWLRPTPLAVAAGLVVGGDTPAPS